RSGRIAPDLADAGDVLLDFGRAPLAEIALTHIHAHVLAQLREARMHLGRYGARFRPLGALARPELGIALRQVLEDGERVPHQCGAVLQDRHLARRRVLQDALFRSGAVEVDADLVEGDAEHLHREPRPQRPGGVVLVADDELHVQSTWAPEARMIGAHLASSVLMKSAVFSGVCPGVGSTPASCRRFTTAGSAIAL